MPTHALIVDDSRLACKVLADMLEPLNITSESVYSADQALEFLQTNLPDIIFLDHFMQGMDGLETLQVIKSNPKTATVPVMMYTAKQGEVYVGQARALGAVDVLPKGLEKDYLHNALAKLGMLERRTIESDKPAIPEQKDLISAAMEVNQQPEQPELKATKEHKTADQDSHSSIISSQSNKEQDWRALWRDRIEPYLRSQKREQTEELMTVSQRHTRFLNREMHKTMESFEHALVLRLEAHDDFLETQRELNASKRRSWLIAVLMLMLIVQGFLIYQFNQLQETNQQLLATQPRENTDSLLDSRLADLSLQIAQLKQDTSQPAQTQQQAPSISLQNTKSEYLADIFPSNRGIADYRGVTGNGYEFYISAQGEISAPTGGLYFLAPACQGDAFVTATPAQLYKMADDELWYIDKFAEQVDVNVNSHQNLAGECTLMDGELMSVRRLQVNAPLETGINSDDMLRLVF